MSQFTDYETEDEEQLQYEYEIQCMENYPYSDDEDDAFGPQNGAFGSLRGRGGNNMRHRIKHTPPHTKPTAGKGKAQHKKTKTKTQ